MAAEVPRLWWVVALQGGATIVYGIVALVWPLMTFEVLVILFGIFVLVVGIGALVDVIGHWSEFDYPVLRLLEGLAGIAAGLFATTWPDLTSVLLLYTIAAWALAFGALQLLDGLIAGYGGAVRRALVVNGALALALGGGLLVLQPAAGVVAVVWLIGIHAVLAGTVILVIALHVRRDVLERLDRI